MERTREFYLRAIERPDLRLHTAVGLKHTGMSTANLYENKRQPRPPRLTPLTHPQPVSPLHQQRPLVRDGLRLRGWLMGWDKFCFVLAETPLHRLRRHRRIRRYPAKQENGTVSSWGVPLTCLRGSGACADVSRRNRRDFAQLHDAPSEESYVGQGL